MAKASAGGSLRLLPLVALLVAAVAQQYGEYDYGYGYDFYNNEDDCECSREGPGARLEALLQPHLPDSGRSRARASETQGLRISAAQSAACCMRARGGGGGRVAVELEQQPGRGALSGSCSSSPKRPTRCGVCMHRSHAQSGTTLAAAPRAPPRRARPRAAPRAAPRATTFTTTSMAITGTRTSSITSTMGTTPTTSPATRTITA